MRSLLVVVLLSSMASLAGADPKPAPVDTSKPAMTTDDCAKARAAKRLCKIDMSGEDVKGGVPSKDGIDTSVPDFVKLGSLLHIRRDYIPEIIKSADDLD
jgi:hypothetical protein